MDRLRQMRPSPAMLVAVAALVAALAGTAVAGVATISKLSGKERKLVAKIARKEADKRITKRAPGLSVASAGTAASTNTANTANTAAQLGKVTVVRQTGSVENGAGGSVDAFCPAGTQAIGGGGRADDFNEPRLLASRPTRAGGEPPGNGESFTGWRVSVLNDSGVTVQPEVWAVCVG
jgi:hypothetical protein